MKNIISIIILSTFLTACNRDIDICGNNNNGFEGGNIIPSFNFNSIVKPPNNHLKPSELIFTWTGESKGMSYTVCIKNTEYLDDCQPLPFGKVSNTNKAHLELSSLILDSNKPFFILAEKQNSKPVKSNEQNIESAVFNSLIQYVKSSNTQANDNFGFSVSLSKDGGTLAISAVNTAVNSFISAGTVYIYRKQKDRWIPETYLNASNPGEKDQFGFSLALSENGNTLAVGAIGESSNARGVNSLTNNDLSKNSGAVYIFKFKTTWEEEAYIKASNTEAATIPKIAHGDEFGHSLSISNDGKTLAVGARYENSGDINNQENNTKIDSGAVYIFKYTDRWTQESYLKASNIGDQDYFGFAVNLSVNGDKLVIGSPGEANSKHDILEDDNLASGSGAVYIFDYKEHAWSQTAYIKASNIGQKDFFGSALDLSADGKTLVSGANQEGSGSTGINNAQLDDNFGKLSGAVYLYRDNGNNHWIQEAYIKAFNTRLGDNFGFSLALSADGNSLAIGADGEDSTSIGLRDAPLDYAASFSGAVYYLTYDKTQGWKHEAYIKASNSKKDTHFGRSLSLSGDANVLVVGALNENSNAININGDQTNIEMTKSGAAYIY